MFCISCGKEIAEGSKFCSFCGAQQEKEEAKVQKMYCTKCRKEFGAEMMFCDECGMKLSPNASFHAADSELTSFNAQETDGKLMEIGMASIYRGNKSIGAAMFSGTVYLYADRIETKAMLAGSPDVFVKMEDIAGVSKGSYMIIWSSLILRLKNGDVFTIAGATTGSETIDRAIKIINRSIVQAIDN